MNPKTQTQATGYAARIAINLGALVVLVPLKGTELGLRIVEAGLDVTCGAFGRAANGVSWAANRVAKTSAQIEAKAKRTCDEVRVWQEHEAGEESPIPGVALPASQIIDLKAHAVKIVRETQEEPKADEAAKPPKQTAKGASGVKVCDICGMPKTLSKFAAHHDMCEERYASATARALELVAAGETAEDAALHGALAAKIRYDGGRPAIVKKLVKMIHDEAAKPKEKPPATLKIVKPPEDTGGTPGSVLDPKPAPA